MPTVVELQDRLEALRKARAQGVTQLRLADGRFIIYRTDAEMAAAIADVERQLAAASGTPVQTILAYGTKGLENP